MRWLVAPLIVPAFLAGACRGAGGGPSASDGLALSPPSESFVSGIVVAVSGESLVLQPRYESGQAIELQVSEETRIWKGEDVTLAAVRVGDRAFATARKGPDGSREAIQVYLNIARADGRIVWRQGETFVIQGAPSISPHTDVAVIRIRASTQFVQGNRSDLQLDRNVMVYGVQQGDGSIAASQIFFGVAATPSP